jgi:hypothetical protein
MARGVVVDGEGTVVEKEALSLRHAMDKLATETDIDDDMATDLFKQSLGLAINHKIMQVPVRLDIPPTPHAPPWCNHVAGVICFVLECVCVPDDMWRATYVRVCKGCKG